MPETNLPNAYEDIGSKDKSSEMLDTSVEMLNSLSDIKDILEDVHNALCVLTSSMQRGAESEKKAKSEEFDALIRKLAGSQSETRNNAVDAFANTQLRKQSELGKQISELIKTFASTNKTLSQLANPGSLLDVLKDDNASEGDHKKATLLLATYNLLQSTSKLQAISATTQLAKAAGIGSVGSMALGGIGGIGLMLAQVVMGQVKALFEAHFTAYRAGNFINSRLADAQVGNYYLGGEHALNAASYAAYRMEMRKMGLRDDAKIAESLRDATASGIYGASAVDAFKAAMDQYAIKSQFGINLQTSDIANLYRGTIAQQGASGFMRTESGAFSLDRLMSGLSYIARSSRTEYGNYMSVNETLGIFDSLTQNMLGLNNSVELALGATKKWAEMVSSNEVKVSEVAGLYTQAGSIPFNSRITLAALSGNADVLTASREMVNRSRTPEGRAQNLRDQARQALDLFRKHFGNDETPGNVENFAQMLLPLTNLGNLADHPNLMAILKKAASGDASSAKEIEKYTESDRNILQRQATTLDAILHPVEHIRDIMFGSITENVASFFDRSKDNKTAYEAYSLGLKEDTTEYNDYIDNAKTVESKEAQDRTLSAIEGLTKAITEQAQGLPGPVEAALRELREIKTAVQNRNVAGEAI